MFTKKQIEIHIEMAVGEFSNGFTTKIIKNLPILVNIDYAGLPGRNTAKIKIYGLNQYDIETLTFLSFKTMTWNLNKIKIFAGDESKGLSLVYQGDIVSSVPEYQNAPDVYLDIEAISGYYAGLMPSKPYSQPSQNNVKIKDVIKNLTDTIGYTFVDDNTKISIPTDDIYLTGTPIQQLNKLSKEYNIPIVIENETVRIYDDNSEKIENFVIKAGNGLIGYPSFTTNGIRIRCDFLPQIRIGMNVKVESIVPKSTGVWNVIGLTHILGNQIQDSPWFTELITTYKVGM